MVGEWMMNPIKIPWFRHPGPSWSLFYLVRGGSRPNLTEGFLSVAMGFTAFGEHTGAGHNHYIVVPFGGKITRFRGPRVITVYPAVPFYGKTIGYRTHTTSLLVGDYLRMDPNGGGMDDEPDQDPMVPSSWAIVVPVLFSQRRHIGLFEKTVQIISIFEMIGIADGGGMDDEPDQDPMVPSSWAIVVPVLFSQRRKSTKPDRRILVGSHGLHRLRVSYRLGVECLFAAKPSVIGHIPHPY
ncbi:hypothetical protein M5K25_015694 [Dendrobium thyrsiflorum]|uniref:Uncharacterized protein n=1 Tax=Dendrobium thyrsiflorum TaxID=117978 RepID=A0ABD0UQZ7_DENTH